MNNESIINLAKLGLEGNKKALLDYIRLLAAYSANKKKLTLYRGLINLLEHYDNSENIIASGMQNTTEYPLPEQLWFTRSVEKRTSRIIRLFQNTSLPKKYRSRFNKILLYGPPGSGKTTIGFYIAKQLKMPIEYIKVSDVISFRFGETLKNIASVFEQNKNSIIFIDEFDAFAKNRFDHNDVGELKRVVNSLIQTLDVLSNDRIVIVATNLVESIDPAILRRFPVKLNIPELTKNERQDFLEFLIKSSIDIDIKLKSKDKTLLLNLMQFLELKTIDAINNLIETTILNAHLQQSKKVEMIDIVESMLNDGLLSGKSIKNIQDINPDIFKSLVDILMKKMPKTEIAELMGIHRNSLTNYVKKI